MKSSLKKTIKDAIGLNFVNLNSDELAESPLQSLLVLDWREIFGKPILIERGLIPYLGERHDKDGIVHEFFDLKLVNKWLDFQHLYAHAIDSQPPEQADKEDELQKYLFTFVNKAVETMNGIQDGKMKIELEIFGCRSRSVQSWASSA